MTNSTKKKNKIDAKKILYFVGAAVLFGVIAALTMTGVNKLMNKSSTAIENSSSGGNASSITDNSSKTFSKVVGSGDVSSIVKQGLPSVVSVTNMVKYKENGFSIFGYYDTGREYETPASGSGFIFGKNETELLIVTNNHVIEDSSSLSVTFNDQKTIDAAIKGTDANEDLAIIAVKLEDIPEETMKEIAIAKLGNSDELEVGEQVVAIGNALGYGLSATSGIISAVGRTLEDVANSQKLIQTDAAINPGNSGGPLFNMAGEVIGINVAKNYGTSVEGMGYAIPITTVEQAIEELSTKKTKIQVEEDKQGYLGIQVTTIDSTTAESYDMPSGVYVYKVVEGSCAEAAGIKKGDVITKFDDQGVSDSTSLTNLLKYYQAGDVVPVTIKRLSDGEYKEKTVEVTLGSKPKQESKQSDSNNNRENYGNDNGQYQNPFGNFFFNGGGFDDFDDFWGDFRGWR